MKDCLEDPTFGDATGYCPDLPTYGLPETWVTSRVTDMSFRALPRVLTREGTNSTVVAWFVSCVGPCTSWTVGGAKAGGVAVRWGRTVFRVGPSGSTMRGEAFNQPIGPWDMSKVTNTEFSACISFPGLHTSSNRKHLI